MAELICPECGEPVVARPPRTSVPYAAHGLGAPRYSHLDGEPLCPVAGPRGYQPADPVERGDDADLDGSPDPPAGDPEPPVSPGAPASPASAAWTPDGTGVMPAGDVGGDRQVTEAYSVRYVRPDRPGALVTVSCYGEDLNADGAGPPRYTLTAEVETMRCTDPADPGGTELWSDYTYRTGAEGRYASLAELERAARAAAEEHTPAGIGWDGRAPWEEPAAEPVTMRQLLTGLQAIAEGAAAELDDARDEARRSAELAAHLEAVRCHVAALNLDRQTLADLGALAEVVAARRRSACGRAEAAELVAALAAETVAGVVSRHRLMAEAHAATPHAAKRAFYTG